MHNYVLRVYCTGAGSPARRRLRCGDWLAPHSARSADLSEGRPSYSHLPRSRHQGVCESRIRDRLHRVHDAHHVPSPANIIIWQIYKYVEFVCKCLCVFYIYIVRSRYPWTGSGQRKSVFYKYSARDRRVPTLAVHILTNPRYSARTYSRSLIAYRMFG